MPPSNNNNPQDYTLSVYGVTPPSNSLITPRGNISAKSTGYNGDIGWKVPSNQIVTIVSSGDLANPDGINTVRGLLNKPFSLSTSSNWDVFNPVPSQLSGFTDAINAGTTALSGGAYSAVSVYSTRRIWKGSDPLALSLDLNFYAVTNAYDEVLDPCIRLQRLSLPSYDGLVPFLKPPGPNPYSFDITRGQASGGDIIEVYVGSLLYFGSVIVKRVSITFDGQYDQNGYPLKANVQIEFETFQIATKQDISNMISPALQIPALPPTATSSIATVLQ